MLYPSPRGGMVNNVCKGVIVMTKFFSFIYGCAFFFAVSCVSAYAGEDITIDLTNSGKGLISVQYNNKINKPIKVQIENADKKYVYNVKDNNKNNFPLQMGIGNYTIMILENVADNKYRVVKSDTFSVTSVDESKLYLNSIQLVNFNTDMKAITELNKLTANAKNTQEKFNIIYDYVTVNLAYDFAKLNNLPSDYIPVIDEIYLSKKGICYDYASLFASALRNLGIPTKLQMGYFTEISDYHAWNQIYLDGKWINVDTTYDSQYRLNKLDYTIIKDSSQFTVVKQY